MTSPTDTDVARLRALVIFREWLEWLDSHDGRLYRRKKGGVETDLDHIATIPPRGAILTLGDLKTLVNALPGLLDRLEAAERDRDRLAKALTAAWECLADAVAIGKRRYADDFRLYSPWPELTAAEKTALAALTPKETPDA